MLLLYFQICLCVNHHKTTYFWTGHNEKGKSVLLSQLFSLPLLPTDRDNPCHSTFYDGIIAIINALTLGDIQLVILSNGSLVNKARTLHIA
jgi:hypothetical protein